MPAISVVIPSYNRGYCIGDTLQSLLSQTYGDFEAIVVDDASEDDTRERVQAMADPRIRYVAHRYNRGGNAARNTGIRHARGDYVAFLDSDDQWAPDKLGKQLEGMLSLGPDYGASYTWMVCVDQHGRESERISHRFEGDWRERILVSNFIGSFSAFMVRTNLLNQIGGLDENLRSCQDWDLFIRLSRHTRLHCLAEHLVGYTRRVGGGNRISENSPAVVQGHRHILFKFSTDYNALPRPRRTEAMSVFFNVFSAAGAVGDAARVGLEVLRGDIRPTRLLLLARGMGRAMKRAAVRRRAMALQSSRSPIASRVA
ncbi:MAG: glycosyltransferase family 2 protein [Rhodocyclaceae bacterium]|nr:MAG: glycosyltransferase family 2 protein [Rhodocyclaceae bacterium]